MVQAVLASSGLPMAPRSIGAMTLSTKARGGQSAIKGFRTSGALKVAFPRRQDAVEGIVLNTSGGLTGGDRFDLSASAGEGSHLILTTQAAERAYRSAQGRARVHTRLSVSDKAVLHWLPQETILFDGAALDRRLDVEIAASGEAVIVEPLVFGRRAMGETLITGNFGDRIAITRAGQRLYWDRLALTGDITARLQNPAVANGMTALASAYYVGPRAEALLPGARRLLPDTGGASLVAPHLLAIRLLAEDSYLLRQGLVPVLEHLSQTTLPKSWSL